MVVTLLTSVNPKNTVFRSSFMLKCFVTCTCTLCNSMNIFTSMAIIASNTYRPSTYISHMYYIMWICEKHQKKNPKYSYYLRPKYNRMQWKISSDRIIAFFFAAQYRLNVYIKSCPCGLQSKFMCTWYAVYDCSVKSWCKNCQTGIWVCLNNPGVNLPAFWVSYDPQPPGNGMSN